MGSSLSTQSAIATIKQPTGGHGPEGPEHPLPNEQTGLYPQLLLFGDIITQEATSTLQPRLQTLYVRRADVINRGFSGYTSVLALKVVPRFLPPVSAACAASQPPVRLVTLFFGANDAALPGNAQHVPLSAYTASLKAIAEYAIFKQHGTKIVIITPAPVDEWQLSRPLSRTAVNARRYAEAAKQLASELKLPCVDLWTAFAKLAGYRLVSCNNASVQHDSLLKIREVTQGAEDKKHGKDLSAEAEAPAGVSSGPIPGSLLAPPNEVLASLLRDGLHFTPRGYDVLYEELTKLIREQVPECIPERMPFVFPTSREILGVPKEDERTKVTQDPTSLGKEVGVDEELHIKPATDSDDYTCRSGGVKKTTAKGVRGSARILIGTETHACPTTKLDTCVDHVRA